MIDAADQFRRWVVAFDEKLLSARVGVVEQQQAISRKTVSPGASDLLIVGFDRAGQVIVNDESNVAFVYPHAERVGGDDCLDAAAHEAVLCAGTLELTHPAVIWLDAEAGHLELGGDLLDSLASCCVDYSGAPGYFDYSLQRIEFFFLG